MPHANRLKGCWLDDVVDGEPIKNWCQVLNGEQGKVFCIYCRKVININRNVAANMKKHALMELHQDNRHTYKQNMRDLSRNALKGTDVTDNIKQVDYPGMNFDCSVNLLPLCKTSEKIRSSDLVTLLQVLVKPGRQHTLTNVYICFFCGEEFVSGQILQNHQYSCHMRPPELLAVVPPETAAVYPQAISTPESASCSQKIFDDIASYYGTSMLFRANPMPCQSKETHKDEPCILPPKGNYMSALNLIPTKKAAMVCKKRRNTECETIDLNDDIPISPTLPRTPKLLLSHLSRDGAEHVAEGSSPSKIRKNLFSSQLGQKDAEANSNKPSSASNNVDEHKRTRSKSLYNLDLTSLLGQFVVKQIKGDPSLHILSDVESHCLTSSPQKNADAKQLRERCSVYPITFRICKGKLTASHTHLYKFTRQQKIEFMHRVNTGLDRKSRLLLKNMKACRVKVARLTKADLRKWFVYKPVVTVDLTPLTEQDIVFWTSPKVQPKSLHTARFPSGLQQNSAVMNILGLNKCQKDFPGTHLVGNCVSEERNTEMTENKRSVYGSILSDSAVNKTNSPGVIVTPTSSPGHLTGLSSLLADATETVSRNNIFINCSPKAGQSSFNSSFMVLSGSSASTPDNGTVISVQSDRTMSKRHRVSIRAAFEGENVLCLDNSVHSLSDRSDRQLKVAEELSHADTSQEAITFVSGQKRQVRDLVVTRHTKRQKLHAECYSHEEIEQLRNQCTVYNKQNASVLSDLKNSSQERKMAKCQKIEIKKKSLRSGSLKNFQQSWSLHSEKNKCSAGLPLFRDTASSIRRVEKPKLDKTCSTLGFYKKLATGSLITKSDNCSGGDNQWVCFNTHSGREVHLKMTFDENSMHSSKANSLHPRSKDKKHIFYCSPAENSVNPAGDARGTDSDNVRDCIQATAFSSDCQFPRRRAHLFQQNACSLDSKGVSPKHMFSKINLLKYFNMSPLKPPALVKSVSVASKSELRKSPRLSILQDTTVNDDIFRSLLKSSVLTSSSKEG